MMVLIRFWRSLTKKDNVKSARYEIKYIFLNFNSSFRAFFSRIQIRIRIFPSGSGFLADPDPDFWPIRIRTQKKG